MLHCVALRHVTFCCVKSCCVAFAISTFSGNYNAHENVSVRSNSILILDLLFKRSSQQDVSSCWTKSHPHPHIHSQSPCQPLEAKKTMKMMLLG